MRPNGPTAQRPSKLARRKQLRADAHAQFASAAAHGATMAEESSSMKLGVYVRLRPVQGDKPNGIAKPDLKLLHLHDPDPKGHSSEFCFDRVFDSGASQDAVFAEVGKPLVDHVCQVSRWRERGRGACQGKRPTERQRCPAARPVLAIRTRSGRFCGSGLVPPVLRTLPCATVPPQPWHRQPWSADGQGHGWHGRWTRGHTWAMASLGSAMGAT